MEFLGLVNSLGPVSIIILLLIVVIMLLQKYREEVKEQGNKLSKHIDEQKELEKEQEEKYLLAAENSKMILEAVKDGTNTDLVEAANSILINMMYEKILSVENLDFKDDA